MWQALSYLLMWKNMDEYSNVLPLYVSFNVPAFLFYSSIKPSRIKANTYNKSTLSFITFSKYVFSFSRWRGALQEDQERVSYDTHQWRRCRQETGPSHTSNLSFFRWDNVCPFLLRGSTLRSRPWSRRHTFWVYYSTSRAIPWTKRTKGSQIKKSNTTKCQRESNRNNGLDEELETVE